MAAPASLADARINAPARGNRRLAKLLDAANANLQLKASWHIAQANADRIGM